RPVLFLENHSEEQSPALLRTIDGLGYACWWHVAYMYNSENYFANRENIFDGFIPESNLMCFPKGVHVESNQLWPVEGLDDTWRKVMARHGLAVQVTTDDPSR